MPASSSHRSSALHQRAVSRAEAAIADPEPAVPRRPTPDAPRRVILPASGVLAIGLVGTALGLGATAIVVGRDWDPGAVRTGSWIARPRVGTAAIDPYAQAELARHGAVPLAANEGLSFVATVDDTGYQLLLTCAYKVSGAMPAARFWTMTATGPDGRTLPNPAGRSGFASNAVVRDIDGRATIAVGPTAMPGNWLPLSGSGALTLTLRLYDTPLAGDAGAIAGAALPAIVRQSCGGTAAAG